MCRNQNLYRAPTVADSRLLKILDLSSNTIALLKTNFFDGFDILDTLIIRSAKIKKIDPDAFDSLKNLKTVDLFNNALSLVPPELFTQNPKLQNISLTNNPLTMQPLEFPILNSSSLQYLILKSCKLSELSTTSLSQVPNVIFIDLSGNRFTVFSADILLQLSHLVYIDIKENEWICCSDFEILVCLAYDKSNSKPFSISYKMKNQTPKFYTKKSLYIICSRLFNNSTSITRITSNRTPLIGGATDTETTRSVNVFPNMTAQSGFSSNINSEPHEDMHECTKGSDENTTVDVTRKQLEKTAVKIRKNRGRSLV
jgi:hypothetical protein